MGNLIDWFKRKFANKFIASIVRHVTPLVTTYLAFLEIDPEILKKFGESTEAILLALSGYLLAQGWSLLEKKDRSPQSPTN